MIVEKEQGKIAAVLFRKLSQIFDKFQRNIIQIRTFVREFDISRMFLGIDEYNSLRVCQSLYFNIQRIKCMRIVSARRYGNCSQRAFLMLRRVPVFWWSVEMFEF